MWTCKNCGKENEDNRNKCWECGALQNSKVQTIEMANEINDSQEFLKDEKSIQEKLEESWAKGMAEEAERIHTTADQTDKPESKLSNSTDLVAENQFIPKVSSISCPVCNNLCSTQAISCPKCGHPFSPNIQAENNIPNQIPPSSPSVGSILRGILWVFLVVSLFYAYKAIEIYDDIPLPTTGRYGNEAEILGYKIAIAYHVAPAILLIIVLAIAYSAKDRR